jgi:predicted Zn-dependent protease
MGIRKATIVIFISFFTVITLHSQNITQEFVASRTAIAPRIDGVLDDPCWINLKAITDFKQQFPVFGADPSQKAEIKITYDNFAIYIGAISS